MDGALYHYTAFVQRFPKGKYSIYKVVDTKTGEILKIGRCYAYYG
jgi:hypothetical protein